MKNYRTFMIRLYPNNKQRKIIDTTFDLCSKMFNELLFRQNKIYSEYLKVKDTTEDIAGYFKAHKRDTVKTIKQEDDELSKDYYIVDSLALEYEEKNLFNAFSMFFKGHNGYPKYKTPKDSHSYYTRCVNDNIYFTKDYIRLPKLGKVDVRGVNPKYLNCEVATVKVYEYKNKKYYAHVVVKFNEEEKVVTDIDIDKVVGLDFKVSSLFVSSDNYIPSYNSGYYKFIDRLRTLEIALKHKSFNSKERKRHVTKIINIHKKIKNIRNDFLHKISCFLSKIYSSVIVETLDLKQIAQNLHNGTNYLRY